MEIAVGGRWGEERGNRDHKVETLCSQRGQDTRFSGVALWLRKGWFYTVQLHLESLFEHAEAQRTPLQTRLSWAHQ